MLHCGIVISKRSRGPAHLFDSVPCFSSRVAHFTDTTSCSLRRAPSACNSTTSKAREPSRSVSLPHRAPYFGLDVIFKTESYLPQRFNLPLASLIRIPANRSRIHEPRSRYQQQQRWIASQLVNRTRFTDKLARKKTPVRSHGSPWIVKSRLQGRMRVAVRRFGRKVRPLINFKHRRGVVRHRSGKNRAYGIQRSQRARIFQRAVKRHSRRRPIDVINLSRRRVAALRKPATSRQIVTPKEKSAGHLDASNSSLQPNSPWHFSLFRARHRAKIGYSSGSLTDIENSVRAGADVNDREFLKVCGLLLRQAARDSLSSSADILTTLLRLNVRPNIHMYNILILQASKNDDPATAWEIYNLIRAKGIDPDEFTYTALMKMCRKTNDSRAYKQLRIHLLPDGLDYMGPLLTTEVLCCRHFFEDRWNFDHMLRAYERYCDLQPLKNLGMIPMSYESRSAGSHPLPRPQATAGTLNVMLVAFFRCYRRPEQILSIYNNFQERLKVGDPLIVPLLRNEYTYNIFMKAISAYPTKFGIIRPDLSRNPPQLQWRNVLKAMTAPPDPSIIDFETGLPLRRLKPTAHSWNIILTAYARAGCVPETEAILELMKKSGLEVHVVTWNSLLSGFSRRQHLSHVAKLLDRMQASEVPANDNTARALSHVEDRRRLLEIVQMQRREREGMDIPSPDLQAADLRFKGESNP